MSKGSGTPAGRRPSSRNAKPYDANNSFVRKMATKVTDFIPQSSWISKWLNPLQSNEDALENRENTEETEDDIQQPPPNKRSRICMDTIHPPGTFSIQTRAKSALNTIEPSKEQYPVHNEREDFSELTTAGPSGINRLISSTPAMQADIRTVTSHKSDLNLASSINNGIINGIDDNSESSESTSGCSSLIPQINRHEGPSNLYNSTFLNRRRHIDDKLTFTNHLQSPRSLFLDSDSRDTLSSRRPSFNASVMTNVLDRASPLSSPFYSGNITFGGANAAGFYKPNRNLFNNSNELQLKVPRRTNIEVKPSNAIDDSSGMSQTAKKILEALEHFSSPISDAKKIPLKNTNNTLFPVMNRKRAREEVASPSARIGLRHLTRELTVPTVPDILKLRRRQKLQDTTLAARKIVSSRSDPPPQEYRLRMDDADNEKYRGKLKGKSKINLEQEETVAPVNLPNVPLPITTLPNFNFTLPFPTLHSAGKTIANKENTFTFASPIKISDVEKNLQSVNNYTFSNPINADDSTSKTIASNSCSIIENIGFTPFSSTDDTTTSMPNFIWSGSSTAPRLKAKVKDSKDDFVEPAVMYEQKSGSVVNVLCSKSDKIGSTLIEESNSGSVSKTTYTDNIANASISPDLDIKNTHDTKLSWECSECMIKNSGTDKQCTACKVIRPNPNDKTSSTSISTINTVVKSKPVPDDCFGSQFRLSTNQWECTTCCVRNKQSDVKCVACSALKPGSNVDVMQQTIKSQNYDLMEKFKPAEGSWECHGCLLRNVASIITCPCCNASKPTSIKTNLKKTDIVTEPSLQKSTTANTDNMANTSQETTSNNHQIINKSPKSASIKTSPKKADTVAESISQKSSTDDIDNIAMQGTTSSNEIMKKFKPSKDSWECSGCLVRNNNSITTCPCCSTPKPNSLGESSNVNQTSTNGFGDKFKKPEGSWNCDTCLIQNDANCMQCVACQALKPGTTVKSNKPASSTSSTLQFKFGVPSNTSNLVNPSGFNFGIDKADNHNSDTASPLNGFKFGNTQQVMRNTSTNATTTCLPTFAQPTFTFSDSKTSSQSTTVPTFGQIPTSSAALSTNLSFGENKLAEIPTLSSNKSASDTPATTLFPIVSSSMSLFNNNESKTTIAFGTDKPAFTTTDSNKPPGFSMPEKIPTFGSNIQDNKPAIFGTPETKLPAVFNSPAINPLPTFGIPSSSSTTPSLFGSSNNSAAFGNNTTPAFDGTATTPTTLFSSTKPSVETNPASNSSLFKFGSASSQQSATGSGFNFSANVNSTTKPLFTFGNNSAPNSNNMFGSGTFGANTASTNTNANFAFNTPKQEIPAAFSQGATTTPIFGAPQANSPSQATSPSFSTTSLSSTGFNFASATPPAAASGGFNFGGMSSTPTGGFNYNTTTTTPTVVFDPNSRPSFNFTKGSAPTAFNAPPQSAAPQRKIKKAFRRCMR